MFNDIFLNVVNNQPLEIQVKSSICTSYLSCKKNWDSALNETRKPRTQCPSIYLQVGHLTKFKLGIFLPSRDITKYRLRKFGSDDLLIIRKQEATLQGDTF